MFKGERKIDFLSTLHLFLVHILFFHQQSFIVRRNPLEVDEFFPFILPTSTFELFFGLFFFSLQRKEGEMTDGQELETPAPGRL